MTQCKPARRIAAMTLAAIFIAAPLAAAHAQPAKSRDDTIRTRVLGWPAGDRLYVAMSADVRYVQGQNATVVVTGPASDIEDIVVENGAIHHDRDPWNQDWWKWWRWRDWRATSPVHIVVTAPHVAAAGVSGSGHLDLGRLAQDRLDLSVSGSGLLDVSGQFKSLGMSVSGSGGGRLSQISAGDMSTSISGSGWIKASGAANSLHVSISGSGVSDMGGLTAQDVDAHLSGSGAARLSPKRSADISVSGSGSVHLLTEPTRLNAHRFGSGAIIHPGGVS